MNYLGLSTRVCNSWSPDLLSFTLPTKKSRETREVQSFNQNSVGTFLAAYIYQWNLCASVVTLPHSPCLCASTLIFWLPAYPHQRALCFSWNVGIHWYSPAEEYRWGWFGSEKANIWRVLLLAGDMHSPVNVVWYHKRIYVQTTNLKHIHIYSFVLRKISGSYLNF